MDRKPAVRPPPQVRKPPPGTPWAPVPYEPADVAAVQALMQGTASSDQQQRVLRWVIEVACATYDLHYHSGKPDDTAFALGRAFAGQQLIKLTKLNASRIRREQDVGLPTDGPG